MSVSLRGAFALAASSLVLVTDIEERAALAASRGLAQAGYRVTGVTSTRTAPGYWSRSCERRVVLPDPREDAAAFLSGLEKILQRREHAILLPGADVSAWLISEHRERLEGLVRLALSDREVVRASLDKVGLIEKASGAGLSAPPSAICSNEPEAIAAARELGFPVVVKPARSFLASGTRFRQRSVVVVTDEAALARGLAEFGSPFIVQRLEERPTIVACAGVMTPERLLSAAVVRWQRRWPPNTGATSFCETIVPPPGLLPKVEALLGAMRFQGIFELELLELSGGQFSAIDLNPRVFGWLSVAVRAGANLPAVLCDWLCGRDPAPVEAAPGVRYRWEDGDLRHFAQQVRHGQLVAAAAVLRPRRRVTHAHFQLADPAPLAAVAGFLARKWLRQQRAGMARVPK